MIWIELVREEAAKAGYPLITDADAEYILWNHTGYPAFWPHGKTSGEHFREQLRAFFRVPDSTPNPNPKPT